MFWSTQKSWSWESLRVGESVFWHSTETGELETRWNNCGAGDGGNFVTKYQEVCICCDPFLIDPFCVVEVALPFTKRWCWLWMQPCFCSDKFLWGNWKGWKAWSKFSFCLRNTNELWIFAFCPLQYCVCCSMFSPTLRSSPLFVTSWSDAPTGLPAKYNPAHVQLQHVTITNCYKLVCVGSWPIIILYLSCWINSCCLLVEKWCPYPAWS